MAMPQVVSGTVPSASVFNTLAQEVDDLGAACTVRRTSPEQFVSNVDLMVGWQVADFDPLGMFSPSYPEYVTIRVAGTYLLFLQERFSGDSGGSSVGQRAGKIMVNGTSVFSHSVASDKQQSATGEGVTLNMFAIKPLNVGDRIYANYWSNHSGIITGLHQNLGGTYLSASRLAPVKL